MTALLVALTGYGPVAAQSFPLPLSTLGPPNSFDIRQDGIYSTAPISLDGAVLFRVSERSGPTSAAATLGYRVTLIEDALQEVLASIPERGGTRTAFDPRTFRVGVVRLGDQAVLSALDDRHRYGLPLLTVTSADARHNGETVEFLAGQWRGVLQAALAQALLKRQPAIFNNSLTLVVKLGALLAIASVLVVALMAFLRRETGRLEAALSSRERDVHEESARTMDATPERNAPRRSPLLLALERVGPQNQLKFLDAVGGLLFWGLLLAWTIAIPWALFLFPQTTPLAYTLSRGATQVATIWIAAAILNRLLDVGIARGAAAWHARYDAPTEERARQVLRVPTVAHALAGFKTFLVVFVALLATLGAVGIPVASVVTIGGLAALGISLAAQNIIRDFVNGFLVLFEDQYVVGDYVTINQCRGLVEQLNLRMVQVREAGGSLTTIGHGSVTSVANESRNWSRVVFRISLDPATDVVRALEVIGQAIESLAGDPDWADAAVGPLETLGIEDQTRDWVLVRATLKTAPLRQFTLRRELQLRVRAALAAAKIALGAAPGGVELD